MGSTSRHTFVVEKDIFESNNCGSWKTILLASRGNGGVLRGFINWKEAKVGEHTCQNVDGGG
jgi:hypothetical protein